MANAISVIYEQYAMGKLMAIPSTSQLLYYICSDGLCFLWRGIKSCKLVTEKLIVMCSEWNSATSFLNIF